jgi:predicted nucleotidyltransferase
MPHRLSPSVKIRYLDKEAIWKSLRKSIKELQERFPEIEQVLLFGSFARGEAVPGSDIDLLIILKDSKLSFLERIVRYIPSKCGIVPVYQTGASVSGR